MKMVVCDVSRTVICDFPVDVGKTIPDRYASSVFLDGSLDLIGRCRRPPQKIARETGSQALVRQPVFWARIGLSGCGGFGRYSERRPSCELRKMAPRKSIEQHHLTCWGRDKFAIKTQSTFCTRPLMQVNTVPPALRPNCADDLTIIDARPRGQSQ